LARDIGPQWGCTIRSINPDGSIADERITEHQLNTDNYGKFLQAIFTGPIAAAAQTLIPSSTDSLGNPYAAFRMWADANVGQGWYYTANFGATTGGPIFQLGTGSTAATLADHVLQTPIAGTQTLNASYVTGSGVVTMGNSITYAAAQTPSECGLYMCYNPGGTILQFLWDHQVFAALASNLTFTVAYTVTLD